MAAPPRGHPQTSPGFSLVHFVLQNNAAASHRAGEGSIGTVTADNLDLRSEFLMGANPEGGGGGLCNFIQKANKKSSGQQRPGGLAGGDRHERTRTRRTHYHKWVDGYR